MQKLQRAVELAHKASACGGVEVIEQVSPPPPPPSLSLSHPHTHTHTHKASACGSVEVIEQVSLSLSDI